MIQIAKELDTNGRNVICFVIFTDTNQNSPTRIVLIVDNFTRRVPRFPSFHLPEQTFWMKAVKLYSFCRFRDFVLNLKVFTVSWVKSLPLFLRIWYKNKTTVLTRAQASRKRAIWLVKQVLREEA